MLQKDFGKPIIYPNHGTNDSGNKMDSNIQFADSCSEQDMNLVNLCTYPSNFKDSRNIIIQCLNFLQISYGTGKPIGTLPDSCKISPYTSLYGFNSVSYSAFPKERDEDGFLRLIAINSYETVISEIKTLLRLLIDVIKIPTNSSVHISEITQKTSSLTEITIYSEFIDPGSKNNVRVPSSTLYKYLIQKDISSILDFAKLGIVPPPSCCFIESGRDFMSNCPIGISHSVWCNAITTNPKPLSYYPVAVWGYSGAQERIICQKTNLEEISSSLNELMEKINSIRTTHEMIKSRFKYLMERNSSLASRNERANVYQTLILLRTPTLTKTEIDFRNVLMKISTTASKLDIRRNDSINSYAALLFPNLNISKKESNNSKFILNGIKKGIENQQMEIKELKIVIESQRNEINKILSIL